MGGKRQGFTQKQSAQLSLEISINCGVSFSTERAVALQKGEQQITEKQKAKKKQQVIVAGVNRTYSR